MKIRVSIFLLISALIFVSCNADKEKKITSDGILTEKEMVSVLLKIHLLDATVETYNTQEKQKIILSKNCYDSVIFQQHEYNDSIFRKSIKYYTLDGKIKGIYDEVIDSLNSLKVLQEQAEILRNQKKK